MFCLFDTKPCPKGLLFTQMLKQGNMNYPAEICRLNLADQLRSQIVNGNYSLIPQYLSEHLEIRKVIKQSGTFHPNFAYVSQIDNRIVFTTQFNCDEAMEADYLMMLYAYCCQQLLISMPQLVVIKESLINGKEQNKEALKITLENLKLGYNQILQLMNNAQNIIPILGTKQFIEIVELSPQYFQMYRQYYLITGNLVGYLIRSSPLVRQQLCATIYRQIEEIKGCLGKDRMSQYLKILKVFVRQLGLKSIIEKYQLAISKEDYSKKKFSIMSLEIIQLSNEILKINEIIQQLVLDEDYLNVIKIVSQKQLVPLAQEQIRIYSNIHHTTVDIQKNEELFLEPPNYNQLENM